MIFGQANPSCKSKSRPMPLQLHPPPRRPYIRPIKHFLQKETKNSNHFPQKSCAEQGNVTKMTFSHVFDIQLTNKVQKGKKSFTTWKFWLASFKFVLHDKYICTHLVCGLLLPTKQCHSCFKWSFVSNCSIQRIQQTLFGAFWFRREKHWVPGFGRYY